MLVGFLTGGTREWSLHVREHPGRIYWRVFPDINVVPRLIGKEGLHSKSMSVLLPLFERSTDDMHYFKLMPGKPGLIQKPTKSPPAEAYDPSPMVEALNILLDAIGVASSQISWRATGKGDDGYPNFEIKISLENKDDLEFLETSTCPERLPSPLRAINAIWRCACAQRGAKMNVMAEIAPKEP